MMHEDEWWLLVISGARAFPDEVDTGSSQEMRNTKKRAFPDEVDAGSSGKAKFSRRWNTRGVGEACGWLRVTFHGSLVGEG